VPSETPQLSGLDPPDSRKRQIAIETLERYAGSPFAAYQPFILLTNFEHYLRAFAEMAKRDVQRGGAMATAHWPEEAISMVQMGVGSPIAALAIDLVAYLEPVAVLMLGLCGGLREKHRIGDYFNPVAAIRDEGTSDHYMPPQCPALAAFSIQKFVTEFLEKVGRFYHTGVVHTTNYRFWEFDSEFRQRLLEEKVQAIDMECATLFSAGFSRSVPVGALLLISDLPLDPAGIKTKDLSAQVGRAYTQAHVEQGIGIMRSIRDAERGLLKNQW